MPQSVAAVLEDEAKLAREQLAVVDRHCVGKLFLSLFSFRMPSPLANQCFFLCLEMFVELESIREAFSVP